MTQEIPQSNESSPHDSKKPAADIHRGQQEVHEGIANALSQKERKLNELKARRERKEISPFDMDLNFLFQLQQANMPLTKDDVQNQAVVLHPDDCEQLGAIDITLPNGEILAIDSDSLSTDDVLIIYPNDLG